MKRFPDLVKREHVENNYVGMHSMTHVFKKAIHQSGICEGNERRSIFN